MSGSSLRGSSLVVVALAACAGQAPGARNVEMTTVAAPSRGGDAPAPPAPHREIAASNQAICELDEAGVRCAGRNIWDAQEPSREWSRVPSTEGAVQLTAGGEHACVRMRDGTARCWGKNDVGQLGLGVGGESSASAVEVVGLRDIVEVRAGMFHTCARLRSGDVLCWGGKIDGVVLSYSIDKTSRLHPARILGGASRLVTGHERSFARTEAGWSSWAPQHGGAAAPVLAPALEDAVDVALGFSDECAVTKQGQVRCWGASHASSYPRPHEPAMASVIPELPPVTQVVIGRAHTCALLATGQVRCWTELNGHRPTSAPLPETVRGITDAVELAAGFDFTCARQASGGIKCWGATEYLPADAQLAE